MGTLDQVRQPAQSSGEDVGLETRGGGKNSNPTLGTKVGWVSLGQSLPLNPTYFTGLLLGKQEEGVLAVLTFLVTLEWKTV